MSERDAGGRGIAHPYFGEPDVQARADPLQPFPHEAAADPETPPLGVHHEPTVYGGLVSLDLFLDADGVEQDRITVELAETASSSGRGIRGLFRSHAT